MTVPRSYCVNVPQATLDRISRRVADADIGYSPDDDEGWRYGVDRSYLAEFRDYWRDSYDWRAQERWFDRFPQFTATIEGIDVHFYHIRGDGDGYPIILSHGWPGSVVEFIEAVPLLAAQGYDVVVPSLPGYGFSGPPRRPIGRDDIARMWRTLMVDVLGYRRFGAQGGDWGSPITASLGRNHADVVAAIHLNLLFARRHPGLPNDPKSMPGSPRCDGPTKPPTVIFSERNRRRSGWRWRTHRSAGPVGCWRNAGAGRIATAI